MRIRGRFLPVAIFAGLVTVIGASLSWACTPATFGTPATPAAPPPPAATGAPSTAPSAPAPAPAPAQSAPTPTPSAGGSGSGATSGATTRGETRNIAGSRGQQQSPARSQGGVTRPFARTGSGTTANSQFAQRSSGSTAGVSARGGQPVFSSSAPSKAEGKKASDSTQPRASGPSTRSATGDLWNGFEPAARSSVFAAEASAGQNGGSGASLAAGLALGFGLTGIVAASLLFGLRRRRAQASSATTPGSRSTTER